MIQRSNITGRLLFNTTQLDPDGDVVLILSARQGNALEPSSSEVKNDTESDDESIISAKSAASDSHESQPMTEATDITLPGERRVRVPSKHLMLASSVFKAMLGNGFQEGAHLSLSGELTLPLPDDDANSLVTLLDVIHGRLKRVPRQLDLGRITAVSILVDKYQLHEVVEMVAEVWINHLKSSIPTSYTQDLAPWIFITWVFNRPNEFRSLTKIAERETMCQPKELFPEWLPIPMSIAASVHEHREEAITDVISILGKAEEQYEGAETQCSRGKSHCDSLTLGDWRRELKRVGLLDLPPYAFTARSLSFSALVSAIKSIDNTTLCTIEKRSSSGHHSIRSIVEADIEDVSITLRGLDLDDFKVCRP